jgi:hypothetical protein
VTWLIAIYLTYAVVLAVALFLGVRMIMPRTSMGVLATSAAVALCVIVGILWPILCVVGLGLWLANDDRLFDGDDRDRLFNPDELDAYRRRRSTTDDRRDDLPN